VHGLAKALVGLGHEIEVFTTNLDGRGVSDVPTGHPVCLDGVQVNYFPPGWFRRLFFAPSMKPALDQLAGSFDVMHLHSVFLWPTWTAARVAVRYGIPYVLSPRGMLVKELIRRRNRVVKEGWIGLIERRNVERAAAIHVTSDVEICEIKRFNFRLPKVLVVPNGIDLPKGNLDGALSGDVVEAVARGPFVLAFGRINWKKNLMELVRALVSIPNGRLIIAGTPEQAHEKELQRESNALGVSQRVSILGREILGADKQHLLANCRALVLPSISENFGNVVLEAMAQAKPVIVSRGVGAAEVVETHHCGIVVQPAAEALGLAIVQMLSNERQASEMGHRGRVAAATVYSWEKVAEQMAGHYAELITSR